MDRTLALWAGFAGVTIMAAGGCAPGSAGPVAFDQREWTSPAGLAGVQLLTEHYDIRTTSPDGSLCEVLPEFVETAHREYARLVPPESTATEPMVIYIFGRREEWALFTRQFAPAQADVYLHILSGGYMDRPSATSVIWDVKRDHTLSLLGHEGLHQYLARHRPGPIPPWVNEGLAAQFEDFDLVGGRPVFRPERNLMRKNSLREALSLPDGLVPLKRLLAMHAGEAVTRTGQPARGYYAQIWATVLFLRTSPDYHDGFGRLLADVGTDRLARNVSAYRAATPGGELSEGEAAFRQYITEQLDDFTDDFTLWARRLVY